jgi:ABC-type uncharacterized transport system YnjBCD ATPase subunit
LRGFFYTFNCQLVNSTLETDSDLLETFFSITTILIINLNLKIMRPLNLKHKMISVLFAIALMLPSCSVYKKNPASLDESVKANARTVVVNTDDSKQEYTRIIQIDNEYYGEIKTTSGTKKVALSKTDIKRIKVLDNNATTLRTIGIVVIPIGIVLAIISLSSLDIDLGSSSSQ